MLPRRLPRLGVLGVRVQPPSPRPCPQPPPRLGATSSSRLSVTPIATDPQTHPNINRGLWTEETVLAHRDQAKSFPVGTELGVLKWRHANASQALLPLSVTCWASGKGNSASATIEYESEMAAHLPLSFVRISIPCGTAPKISDVGEGEARYNSKLEVLEWRIELIEGSNKNGSIEFTAPDTDPSSFFPIQVSFTASGTLSGLEVATVADARSSKPVAYAASYALEVEDYQIA